MPEFVKASLDEEESSHIDYDDDEAQTLVIVDYPNADEDDAADENTLLYTTLPLGVVIMKGYIVTICLYDNLNIEDMAKGKNTWHEYRYENTIPAFTVIKNRTAFLDLFASD